MQSPGVLFVCLGNICRSPLAQAIFQQQAAVAGFDVRVDSCGTASFNIGKPPDSRAIAAAATAGLDISGQRARQICDEDFARFDYLIAMDAKNLANLRSWVPVDFEGTTALLLDFDRRASHRQIPDPYYAAADAFAALLPTLERGCSGLLQHLRDRDPR